MGRILKELQLMQSTHEPCLFYAVNGEKFVLLALYIDDLLITGTDDDKINTIRKRLKQIYTIKDLGVAKKFLGLELHRETKNGPLTITQMEYIRDLIKSMNLCDANAKSTPKARFGNFPMTKVDDYLPNNMEYRWVIGKFQFVASHTRPDVAHAVNYCARFQQNPERIHWKLTQRVLRYVKGTAE